MSNDEPSIVMLKKHKNGFLREIENVGLEPLNFETLETILSDGPRFVLEYRGTPFRFIVRVSTDSYVEFDYQFTPLAPGFKLGEWKPERGFGSIDEIYSAFAYWIRSHLEPYLQDHTEPDLWAQIQSQKSVVSDTPLVDGDRELFTEPEQAQLQMAIKEFRQLVIDKFEPTEEHLALIEDRLDYLSEQVPKLNRINWRSLALSTLISISIALSLNDEQGKELFELFRQVFSNVILLLQ